MIELTLQQTFDHHSAYHGTDKAIWCMFCVPFMVRDRAKLEKVA